MIYRVTNKDFELSSSQYLGVSEPFRYKETASSLEVLRRQRNAAEHAHKVTPNETAFNPHAAIKPRCANPRTESHIYGLHTPHMGLKP